MPNEQMMCNPDAPDDRWTVDRCSVCHRQIGCDAYMGDGRGGKKHMDCDGNVLLAVQGEGGIWMMTDEVNKRTYKPGQLWDTYDREPNDVLIVQDKDGNRYRWTQQAWVAWNDQRSDALRRA